MDKEKLYTYACICAVRKMIDRGSSGYVIKTEDGNWEDCDWNVVLDWLHEKEGE